MRELRIGLVLYGGVSLAVYMNGIVTELWQALRASQALRSGNAAALEGPARIYANLLEALDRADDAEPIRIVVDALAGTSAGGVNAAVLGKAIVEVVKDPETQKKLRAIGFEPTGQGTPEFTAHHAAEVKRWVAFYGEVGLRK